MLGFAKKLFGSSNDRKVKAMQAQVQQINALELKFATLSDAGRQTATDDLVARLRQRAGLK